VHNVAMNNDGADTIASTWTMWRIS
jgi:hypothetical protein